MPAAIPSHCQAVRRPLRMAHVISAPKNAELTNARNHANRSSKPWNTKSCRVGATVTVNQNPRFEDFDISNDPDLFAFLQDIHKQIFSKTPRDQGSTSPQELQRQFVNYGT